MIAYERWSIRRCGPKERFRLLWRKRRAFDLTKTGRLGSRPYFHFSVADCAHKSPLIPLWYVSPVQVCTAAVTQPPARRSFHLCTVSQAVSVVISMNCRELHSVLYKGWVSLTMNCVANVSRSVPFHAEAVQVLRTGYCEILVNCIALVTAAFLKLDSQLQILTHTLSSSLRKTSRTEKHVFETQSNPPPSVV